GRVDVADDIVGSETGIEDRAQYEFEKLLQAELMCGHAEDDLRPGLGTDPVGADVTDGAIQAGLLESEAIALGHADRQVLSRLVDEAEGGQAARQSVRIHRRQYGENPFG